MSETDIHITEGSIFHDAELNFPLDHRIKAELVDEIGRRMATDGLSQVKAAARMDIAQPDLSNILMASSGAIPLTDLPGCLPG